MSKIGSTYTTLAATFIIKQALNPIRGSQNVISKVTFMSYDFNGERVSMYSSPMSMIKNVLLQEHHAQQHHRFYNEINDASIFYNEDISITYNRNMLSHFSYSLDCNPIGDKYDFVTVALRDIAIGLGFGTRFTAKTAINELEIMDYRLTPFESLIMNAIGTQDPSMAFTNATKGSISVPLKDYLGSKFGSLSVYAPETWINGASLHYLIPTENSPISKLLTYDFGKGYIMRDLSGVNWSKVFCGALDWRRDITTSSTSGSVYENGSTEDVLPYKGSVNLSFNNNYNSQSSLINEQINQETDTQIPNISNSKSNHNTSPQNDTFDISWFNFYSPQGPSYHGLSLSVLKKDGTWDCIYTTPNYGNSPLVVTIDSLALNYNDTEYARGTTGGLKYRLTKCEGFVDKLYQQTYYTYNVKYFTRDFTPQIPRIKYSKVHIDEYQPNRSGIAPFYNDDDYFVDVEIGISDIEGTTKVVVEQLDEGERLPFQYEVEDFRKGYFIANLDRELSTQLTVISYNDNGLRRSKTITVPPIGFNTTDIFITKKDDKIEINGLISERELTSGKYSYALNNITNLNNSVQSGIVTEKAIDISDLQNGIYVFSLFRDAEKIKNLKFAQ